MTRYILQHSLREQIADGVLLVLGVAAAIAGVTGLLVWASLTGRGDSFWPLALYALGLIASFSLSAAYNLTLHAPSRAILRRLDHAAIFLLIAGTYTPLALLGLGGWQGTALTLATWGLALIGLVMKLCFFPRWDRAGFVLYLGQGWLGLLAIWPLVHSLPPLALALLLAGGLTYTVGTVFYHRDGLPYARAIWHLHVLAAAAAHYVAVILVTQTH
ncbi:hemolysin III family protein [Salipiger marinus]|uniref:PAQR family membrane homeostasis protein TrhA n=1 Tax=Salipiger marinus TaxID=555512 RepID=UPI001E391B43|nr:hemolysin III family protein [Salipiger manganoxidans]MCD1617604.1 hemolysin III family protein [Salipiger manganoxidans]MEB3419588.1 hemolysin III family protein [Salipiger manganoxidans]